MIISPRAARLIDKLLIFGAVALFLIIGQHRQTAGTRAPANMTVTCQGVQLIAVRPGAAYTC